MCDKEIKMEIGKLFEVIKRINQINNNSRMSFEKRFDQLLSVIVESMESKSGSILLVKGRKGLEIAASTKKELKGLKLKLEEGTPSEWVVRNKRNLYVDSRENSDCFIKRFHHYEGTAFFMTPILLNGKVIGIISVTDKADDLFTEEEREALMDIAGLLIGSIETQRMAKLLKSRKKELSKKNEKLHEHENLRCELFNMLVHDLKGPISAITANLDILAYTLGKEKLEFVDAARTGSDNLYSMVCNLLDIARMEEGNFRIVYERIDPSELVREAISRISGMGVIKKVEITEIKPDDLPHYFWGDRTLLLRVIMNLLSNAIGFSPEEDTVEAGFDIPEKDKIRFFVKDHGPGVPEDHRDDIFNKYYQLERKREGRIHTTGLGLTFCKMAVEAHEGDMEIQDNSPRGSCFYFKLPVEMKKNDKMWY